MSFRILLGNLLHQAPDLILGPLACHARTKPAQKEQPFIAPLLQQVSSGRKLLLHHQGNPNFRPHTGLCSLKTLWSYSYNGEWMKVDLNGFADRLVASTKM